MKARIAVTGKGTSGSWKVRGVQLGTAIEADVLPRHSDFSGHDLVVAIKRIPPELVEALKRSKKPWVWDIVDAWPQPVGNSWSEIEAVMWLRAEIDRLKPAAIVFPNSQMLHDSLWSGPYLVLPHHAWPKYHPVKTRQMVHTVGYEGGDRYLGYWHQIIEWECKKRGWYFSFNGNMEDCDIGIALRCEQGYPAQHWKSNCKLANLQALAIPAICSPEKSYKEFGSGAESFVLAPEDLAKALDGLSAYQDRVLIGASMSRAAPRLEAVAKDYRRWLEQLNF